jgi:F-type H+-transporting ATPase subunit delta
MLNNLIIARPYANAVFVAARDTGQFALWQDVLAILANAARDESFNALFNDPRIMPAKLAEISIALLPNELRNDEVINFVTLLTNEHRLQTLPEIAELYGKLLLDYKNILIARVVSRGELTESQQRNLTEVLQQKFNKQIELQLETSNELLGGMMVYIGDVVFDGSLQNKLLRLKASC